MVKLLPLLAGLSCIAGLVCSSPSPVVVSPSLMVKVAGGQVSNIVIVVNSPVSTIVEQYHEKSYDQLKRGQRITAMRQSLIDFTSQTQVPIRSFLQSKGVAFESTWITNKLFVKNANESLILELISESSLRSSIKEIREEIVVQIDPIQPVLVNKNNKTTVQDPVQEGVNVIGAPTLWEAGNTGEGIIVSNIDTGVRATHEILAPNYVGEYEWYDPATDNEEPDDDQGHGTHTMGTIAGQNGYGVAPGTTWMACKACSSFFGCFELWLIRCAEFTICPHLPDKTNPDCSKAPHVSSNSWSSPQGGLDFFDDAIAGLKSAGIIPIWSAGNAGPQCRTIGSPGDRDVIATAATDFDDLIAGFSSRGPAVDDRAKPEISAPGANVISSWHRGDDSYSSASGTSMACPHVSGAVALLLAGNPELMGDYDAVRAALLDNAKQDGVNGGGQNCNGIPDSVFPNPVLGHGRLDVPASVGFTKVISRQ